MDMSVPMDTHEYAWIPVYCPRTYGYTWAPLDIVPMGTPVPMGTQSCQWGRRARMHARLHAPTHACTHKCTHTQTDTTTHRHTNTHTHNHTREHTHTHTHSHTLRTNAYAKCCVHVYTHAVTRMPACMHACVQSCDLCWSGQCGPVLCAMSVPVFCFVGCH